MKSTCAANRAKLVDEPIVEMLLAHKYFKSGIKFMKADLQSDFDGTDIICYANGIKRSLNVKRNSSKYFNSPNFSIAINKNKVDVYNNTSYIFIDEVADCLYIVDGLDLYKYILEKSDNVRQSDKKADNFYLVIPKRDIITMIGDNHDHIIKYNKAVANLFASGRDESMYMNLT
jgi:hypothetical protein